MEESQKDRRMINVSAIKPHTLLGRIIRYPFRVLPQDSTVPILQGPLSGRKWIVGSHIHGCWLGSYEFEIQKQIASELRLGDVFYDIGANVGFYSLLAATLTKAPVYAFEPSPANLLYLRKHLELNRIENVEVMEMAISDEVGAASFETAGRATGRLSANGNARVRTSTLDALLSEHRIVPPNCIKIDIEGAELQALRGARDSFAMYRPKLFLATHGADVRDQCCRLLASWNYGLQDVDHAELFAFPE